MPDRKFFSAAVGKNEKISAFSPNIENLCCIKGPLGIKLLKVDHQMIKDLGAKGVTQLAGDLGVALDQETIKYMVKVLLIALIHPGQNQDRDLQQLICLEPLGLGIQDRSVT
ncbi:MAG: hypothetical protein ABIJ37_04325 [Pseudomonadota bacterium]